MASRRRIVFWSLVVASFLVLTALSDVRAVGSRRPQISPAAPKPVETLTPHVYLPLVMQSYSQYCLDYLDELSQATYEGILAMVEPSTGLPHDRFDASLFDIMPQFPVVRRIPYTSTAPGASLESWRCTAAECRHSGDYGLKLTYSMPPGMWGSYNVDSRSFDVSQAAYLEAWVQGARGGEEFEFVLWSDCQGGFPGRPLSAEISATTNW